MRFEAKLQSSVYEPWKDSYLNYTKLKGLLYERDGDETWGERNESRFVEELDSELEKVFIPPCVIVAHADLCLST
jgi:vacuolar transporter chaperone complex subunit 2/3